MSFTITKSPKQIPDYAMLCKLAEQNQIRINGDERTGTFGGRGVEGAYESGEQGLRGTFAGHGVTGEFSFEVGKAEVTITDKPFWLPEPLLKEKIAAGLEKLCDGQA